jgi:hypothetical protein
MMEIDDDTCSQCGRMDQAMPHQRMAEDEGPHHHPGHASNCTCPDCSRFDDRSINEKTPPGREKQVKALKKKKNVKNPWAVSWASYDKSHKE